MFFKPVSTPLINATATYGARAVNYLINQATTSARQFFSHLTNHEDATPTLSRQSDEKSSSKPPRPMQP
jgi:hypothetical protein